MDTQLSERDLAEVKRSADEAKKLVVEPVNRTQIERYLNPSADTPYPLEYAFHLLGDVRGRTVLDFGCGAGENLVPLIERGARAIGLDVSPELIALTRQRLDQAGVEAEFIVGSAYSTGLPDASVDVIFSISLLHHLDIKEVRKEMLRILAKGGRVILKEPIRFSKSYARARKLLPAQDDISEFEHPLTRDELAAICEPFQQDGLRYFRLPLVPLLQRVVPPTLLWNIDKWLIRLFSPATHYTTSVVVRLQK